MQSLETLISMYLEEQPLATGAGPEPEERALTDGESALLSAEDFFI